MLSQGRECVLRFILIPYFTLLYVQVKVYNISEHKHGNDDVLIMGTDGLWDVTSDREVADAVKRFLSSCEPNDPMRYF